MTTVSGIFECFVIFLTELDEFQFLLLNYYLTIISRARMGYWLRGHEGKRNNCFSKIQLVGQRYRNKTTFAS